MLYLENYKGNYPNTGERVICLKNDANAKRCPIYNGVIGTVMNIEEKDNHLKAKIRIDGEEEYYFGKISKNIFSNPNPDLRSEWIMEEVDAFGDDVDKISRFLGNRTSYRKKSRKLYLDCFDFGFCLTTHKSQGSEWERVMVIEQNCSYWSGDLWNRWLYTAVTRSTSELLIVR